MRSLHERGKLAPEHADGFVTPRPAEELFDLAADPHGQRNLAPNPEAAPTLNELRSALEAWQSKTADHFLGAESLPPDTHDRRTGKKR
jgi:hypothetical protein